MVKPWPTVQSTVLGDFRIFRAREERRISPRTGQPHDFYVLDCPDWVNVVALTDDGQAVLVEQFRHGTNGVELEVPGGVMDAQDPSPVATGVRELREETGYEGEGARVIGSISPNPFFMTNRGYTVLVERCRLCHALELDHSEDVTTRLVPVAELANLVATGRIRHALAAVALYHFELQQRHLVQS